MTARKISSLTFSFLLLWNATLPTASIFPRDTEKHKSSRARVKNVTATVFIFPLKDQRIRFKDYFLDANPDVKSLKTGAVLTLGVRNGTICHESILQNKSNTQMAINGKQTHPGCVLVWASWPAWQKQQGTVARAQKENTNTHTCSCLHVYLCYICAPHSTASCTEKTAISLSLHSCTNFYFISVFCVNKQRAIVCTFRPHSVTVPWYKHKARKL